MCIILQSVLYLKGKLLKVELVDQKACPLNSDKFCHIAFDGIVPVRIPADKVGMPVFSRPL